MNHDHDAARPLPSWRDGAGSVRAELLRFVEAVSTPDSGSFVPPKERIATFDMDGTIYCEKPLWLEMAVAKRRLAEKAERDAELRGVQPYAAAWTDDDKTLKDHFLLAQTTAYVGYCQDRYMTEVERFVREEEHPTLRRTYDGLFYRPMRELLEHLVRNDFQVYVVSGSCQGLVRAACEGPLGIDRSRLVGSLIGFEMEYRSDGSVAFLRQGAFLAPADVGDGKPESIRYRIGRPPILAFGNTQDDIGMLSLPASSRFAGNGATASFLLVHDDDQREFDYRDRNAEDTAHDRDWRCVSMREEFLSVF